VPDPVDAVENSRRTTEEPVKVSRGDVAQMLVDDAAA